MQCTQSGCAGTIVDGYCDVCGMAAGAPAVTAATAAGTGPAPSSAAGAPNPDPGTSGSARLGSVAIGSQRSAQTAAGTRATRRITAATTRSQLGAGITSVPPAPSLDPMSAVMADPTVSEDKRHCAACGEPVGRSRAGRPGKTSGFCPKCGARFSFDPTLAPGMVVGGQYEVVGCLAHGGMGWIYLARDRNVNNRWVVLKGLLNAGDEDGYRAAVAEKEYLAEVEHPLIVEIYNFVTAPDGASYIVMEYVGGKAISAMLKERMAANNGVFAPIPLDQALAFIIEVLPAFSYLHAHGLVYCDFKPANLMQVAESIKLIDLGGVRKIDDDVSPIYGDRRVPGARGRGRGRVDPGRYLHDRPHPRSDDVSSSAVTSRPSWSRSPPPPTLPCSHNTTRSTGCCSAPPQLAPRIVSRAPTTFGSRRSASSVRWLPNRRQQRPRPPEQRRRRCSACPPQQPTNWSGTTCRPFAHRPATRWRTGWLPAVRQRLHNSRPRP